jgi:hypothetical protein
MEGLDPTLLICLEARFAIESGESLRSFLREKAADPSFLLRRDLLILLHNVENGQSLANMTFATQNQYTLSLFQLLAMGMYGEPIVARLRELEVEIRLSCDEQIDLYISALPLKGLVPLLFLQFPAFLLLLFGPILNEFLRGMS